MMEAKGKAEPANHFGTARTPRTNPAPTSAPGGGTGPFMAIDFGTTNSSMAWYNSASGSAEPIRNEEGDEQTPSVVYYGEQETLIGKPALRILDDLCHIEDEQERERDAERLIRSIKRDLTDQRALALPDGRTVTPVDVAAEIIAKLKRDAEKGHFGEEVARVVLTCPAEFDEMQRGLLEQAARQAGFKDVTLLEEPEAAAIAYAHAGLKVGNGVLVYDLGGGTLDLAIVTRKRDGQYERAMEAMGDSQCGGDDFDQALYGHWDKEARQAHGRGLGADEYRPDPYLLAQARERKQDLTYREKVGPFPANLPGGGAIKLAIDRHTFEMLIAPRVDQTVEKAARMYREAKERGHEVDTVVLIGGASLIPLIRRRLAEVLPLEPQRWQFQHVAVALGAAYHGHVLWASRTGSQTAPDHVAVKPVSDNSPSGQPTPHRASTIQYRKIATLRPSTLCPKPSMDNHVVDFGSFALAPDGKTIGLRLRPGPNRSGEHYTMLIDIPTGQTIHMFTTPAAYDTIMEMQFSPDNKFIILFSNKSVEIFDRCKLSAPVKLLQGGYGSVSPNSAYISVGRSSSVSIVETVRWSELSTFKANYGRAKFCPDSTHICLRQGHTLQLNNFNPSNTIASINKIGKLEYWESLFGRDCSSIIFSAARSGVFSEEQIVGKWDVARGTRDIWFHEKGIRYFHGRRFRDGNCVAIMALTGICLLDPDDGRQLSEIPVRAKAVDFSADGEIAAVLLSDEGTIEIFRIADDV